MNDTSLTTNVKAMCSNRTFCEQWQHKEADLLLSGGLISRKDFDSGYFGCPQWDEDMRMVITRLILSNDKLYVGNNTAASFWRQYEQLYREVLSS